jgi:hypothetical protein
MVPENVRVLHTLLESQRYLKICKLYFCEVDCLESEFPKSFTPVDICLGCSSDTTTAKFRADSILNRGQH